MNNLSQDRKNAGVPEKELFELAGRSFASYLGYPSFRSYLHRSSYFTADLTHNTISGLHLSEPAAEIMNSEAGKTYSRLMEILLRTWVRSPLDDDIRTIFDRERLISQFALGETFHNHGYDSSLSGRTYRKQLSCRLYEENGAVFGTFLIYDVTDIYDANARILRRAEFDGLTGLFNKSSLETHITEFLTSADERENESAAVILIDLDFFKRFNDQYGHDVGDIVLRAAARSLERFFGRDSIIGRNGGDEFLVLLKHRSDTEADEEIKRFSDEEHSVEHNGTVCRFTFSIGYAMYPEQGRSFGELVSRADMAMYNVKMNHRNDYRRYTQDMQEEKRTQLSFNLSDIVSGIPGAILVYKADEKEEILFANEQLYSLFECSSMNELLAFSGDSFRNIVHPDDLNRVEDTIKRQLRENTSGLDYVSYRIITKTGKVRHIDDIGHLVHTPKYGEIFYVFLYDREQRDDILSAAGECYE